MDTESPCGLVRVEESLSIDFIVDMLQKLKSDNGIVGELVLLQLLLACLGVLVEEGIDALWIKNLVDAAIELVTGGICEKELKLTMDCHHLGA